MADSPRTVRQAAKELNLSEFTVRSWVGQRRIAHLRLGRSVRIPAEEIQRLLEDGLRPARRQTA